MLNEKIYVFDDIIDLDLQEEIKNVLVSDMNIGMNHFLGITLMISPYRLMIQIVKGDLDLHMSTFYMREKKK